jgi:phosphoribosylaminoimidazole-succinocarboxamide synthase
MSEGVREVPSEMIGGGRREAVSRTALPLRLERRGKVRDVYDVDADRLLIVATDRVSAFDVVMREPIPGKGAVLTQLTAWWLSRVASDIPHHMITADAEEIVREVPALAPVRDQIRGRAMLCLRATVFPVECVIRGYLAGSAWKEYRASGTLAGEALRAGLIESERLDPPIFSPATKAESGHDENITVSRVREQLGADTAAELERLTRLVYGRGGEIAEERGIIIADTKLEFGQREGRIILIDEVLTPDSSRFWPADRYEPGRSQPSFDKQPLRDWLDRERQAGRWNGDAPPPALPDDVVRATSERYLDAFRRITGSPLAPALLS